MTEQYYIAVKASIHSTDTAVFGLTPEELSAIAQRLEVSNKRVINGVIVRRNPLVVINSLSELGYRVVCSAGEGEVLWTLRREVLAEEGAEPEKVKGNILGNVVVNNESECVFKNLAAVKEIERPKRSGSEVVSEEDENTTGDSKIWLVDPGWAGVGAVPQNPRNILLTANWSSEDNPLSLRNRMSTVRPPGCTDIDGTLCPVYWTNTMEGQCNGHGAAPAVLSVHQTLDEMNFERGLWYAAMVGESEKVRRLLEKGHCPNGVDSGGYCPIHYAARCGHTGVCAQLLEAGADVNVTTRAGNSTPLHRAALVGREDTVRLLIAYGANAMAKDADGRIPLHRAVEGRSPGAAAVLLQASPSTAYEVDRFGNTPIALASLDPIFRGVFSS